MIASVTELNLKNFLCFLRFVPHAVKSKYQAEKARGVVSVRLGSRGILTQRTLTVWENEESLKDYVHSGAHLLAMQAFAKLADISYTAHFEVAVPPTWEEALDFLRTRGKAHPSVSRGRSP